jgi:hypothetical protein
LVSSAPLAISKINRRILQTAGSAMAVAGVAILAGYL